MKDDLEERLRACERLELSRELRGRVLAAAGPLVRADESRLDRLWFSRNWRLAAVLALVVIVGMESVSDRLVASAPRAAWLPENPAQATAQAALELGLSTDDAAGSGAARSCGDLEADANTGHQRHLLKRLSQGFGSDRMTDAQPQRHWMVRGRRLAVIVVVVVLVFLVVRAVSDVWLGRRLNDEIARLDAKYGPLRWDTVRKVHPWKTWPRLMAPNNRARLMDAAAARVTLSSDANADLVYQYGPDEPSLMTSDQAREIAAANREAVELAIRAAQLPHSNWAGGVPDLGDLTYLAKDLAITARHETDTERADAAAAAVMAGFAEATAVVREPHDIMLLHGVNMAWRHEAALRDVLNRAEPSRAALADLAAVIDQGLIAHPAREAMLGELKRRRAGWPAIERGGLWGRSNFLDDWAAPTPPSMWMRGVAWALRPVIRFMALRDLTDKARAVEAASLPPGERARVVPPPSSPAPNLITTGDGWTWIAGRAAIGVALRRFRIDHGAYPTTLDELTPTYLELVPVDPRTARPPDYVRSGAGFELRGEPLWPGQKPPEWKVAR